jgi:orotate phosphoribosyltransferase
MHYRSFDDLNNCIIKNLSKIPADIDLIVGIPRSGLLAANILALHLNLPFTDLNGFIGGKIISGGQRLVTSKAFHKLKNIVVLDDSILTGNVDRQLLTTL